MKAKVSKTKKKGNKIPAQVKKTIKPTSEVLIHVNQYFNKYGFYILLALLTIIILFVFWDFIFLNKLYLFKDIGSDSINANYPHGYQVAYYMNHVSFIPKWSFYQGMGQNIFPLSIPDPYYFILMLFGAENLAYGIALMEITKIFSAGILFYLFLKKLNISNFASIIGAISYAFSSFIIIGSCWNIFSSEAVYIALLLYAFEKLYQDNKIILFPIAIFLVAINQPFDLFLISLFLGIYILFRYFSQATFNFKKLGILLAKVMGLGLLGVLISSFFLFGDIVQMLESPRVGGESSYFAKLLSRPVFGLESKLHNVTALLRLFSSDMMGTGSDFRGWYNYLEAPLFYFGLINLLLVPQVFQFLDKKKKIVFSVFIALFLVPVIFPFFRYSFWAFTGDYYRVFSLFTVTCLLIASVMALNLIEKDLKINFITLAISTIILFIILFHNYFPGQDFVNENVRNWAGFFLILYAISLCLLKIKRIRNVIKPIILLLAAIELISFSNITINDRPVMTGEEFKQKIGYNDYTNEAVQYLKSRDREFFRINKDYSSGLAIHTSINDAQVQKFYGTPSYNSFNQINYIKFLQELGIVEGTNESQTRWANGLYAVPFLHPFASVKYALTKSRTSFLFGNNYDSLSTAGDVEILKNRYFLPLGFTYEKFISLRDFRRLSVNQKRMTLYKAFALDDSSYSNNIALPQFHLKDTSLNYSWQEYSNDIAALKRDTLHIETFNQNLIKGSIKAQRRELLFFSIPFDKGWKLKIDNQETKPMMVNVGFMGIVLDKGDHIVQLSFTPRFLYTGGFVSLAALAVFILVVAVKFLFDRGILNKKEQQKSYTEKPVLKS